MIQCKDCEFFHRGEDGQISFSCDPFATIVEPECLAKWQLIKTNQLGADINHVNSTLHNVDANMAQMVASYRATLEYYNRFAPMQEKMFNYMEREIDEANEGEKWKIDEDEEEDENEGWGSSY
ncbi:MAG: hypothetical protein ACLFV7_01205 [Phycisphaerae bacterium]